MTPIEPPPPFSSLGRRIGIAPEAAIALASMFQLVEACLGRSLEAECCCSPALSRDERAILTMLAAPQPPGPHQSYAPIPHGLPAALHWAIASVRALLGEACGIPARRSGKCPFAA